MQTLKDAKGNTRKWQRLSISGIIALLQFAAIFPNRWGKGTVLIWSSIYIIILSLAPFLWISFFAGRNKIAEAAGWIVQVVLLVLMFIG
jgi:hypothetical protein